MKKNNFNKVALGLSLCLSTMGLSAQENAYIAATDNSIVKAKGLDMGSVTWTDGFWKDRFDMTLSEVAPAEYDYFMDFAEHNIKIVAEGIKDDPIGFKGTNWQDGDYCKWLEAHISVYSVTKDPELLKIITEKSEQIAKSVAEDGYFSTHTQIGYGIKGNGGRWDREAANLTRFYNRGLHETYNMGHFLTLCTTHYRVTGDRLLLDAAIKVGDFLDGYFDIITPEKADVDYNQTHLMGLMELYRCTGEKRYLDLVGRFIDARGNKGGLMQNQNERKLRDEDEAVGHAVLGPVTYIGATDYAVEANDQKLIDAMKRIWDDIYTRKASFTGGIGNVHEAAHHRSRNQTVHEAFGERYKIHSSTAYNETCATYYGAYFSWRLFMLTGEVKYLDTMEKAFYNNLSAMAIDGKSYFYTNVLRWYGEEHDCLTMDAHKRWTESCNCVCCPTSVVRFLAQTKEYAYAADDNSLYVTMYGSNNVEKEINGKTVKFTQQSNYPWDGDITLNYCGDKKNTFDLKLRIPEWAVDAKLSVNGEKVAVKAGEFATISRTWGKNDKVELDLNMTPTLNEANAKVEELRGQVVVSYGPLTYCAEAIDLPKGVEMQQVMIPVSAKFDVKYEPEFMRGANVITVDAVARTSSVDSNKLYAPLKPGYKDIKLKLIPYYSWANRGDYEMTTFFPVKW